MICLETNHWLANHFHIEKILRILKLYLNKILRLPRSLNKWGTKIHWIVSYPNTIIVDGNMVTTKISTIRTCFHLQATSLKLVLNWQLDHCQSQLKYWKYPYAFLKCIVDHFWILKWLTFDIKATSSQTIEFMISFPNPFQLAPPDPITTSVCVAICVKMDLLSYLDQIPGCQVDEKGCGYQGRWISRQESTKS